MSRDGLCQMFSRASTVFLRRETPLPPLVKPTLQLVRSSLRFLDLS
jgi:hypothetical protein